MVSRSVQWVMKVLLRLRAEIWAVDDEMELHTFPSGPLNGMCELKVMSFSLDLNSAGLSAASRCQMFHDGHIPWIMSKDKHLHARVQHGCIKYHTPLAMLNRYSCNDDGSKKSVCPAGISFLKPSQGKRSPTPQRPPFVGDLARMISVSAKMCCEMSYSRPTF